jgi:PKD repeat protein
MNMQPQHSTFRTLGLALLCLVAITVDSTSTTPTADFSSTTSESTLTVDFSDGSTDSDGSIAFWSWDFGDSGTSTVQNPLYTYDVAGTYGVTLTVTDNNGNSDTANLNVTVPLIPGGTKKSLVLMLDGLRADGIINANTPNIDSLINGTFGGGAYNGAYAYYAQTIQDKPTSSAYNHVSIMTGVTGDKHGANGNDYDGIAAADYNTYPTYLSTLESDNSNLNTAFLVTWGADLGMVSGADYVMGQSDASNVDRAVNIIKGTFSDASGDNGTSWSSGTDVDAITLFLDDIDIAGHDNDYSPANTNYIAEVESIDVQIGQILTAIQNRSNFANENWQIIITSDHGGFASTHGNMDPNSETIPFIVASKSVSQGLLANRVMNYDAAATAVAHHLGETGIPSNYDGVAQGDSVIPAAPAGLTDSLVVYLPFNGNTLDASGRSNDASIGAGSDHDPIVNNSGGKFGGYVEINDFGGGTSDSSYLTLGTPADLDFGAATHFTITTWFRAQNNQSGASVILGNKNWADGSNIGTLLLADELDGDDFGFNIGDGTRRRYIEPIDYIFDEWWFQAISVDRNGNAVMFVGSPSGELYAISDFADDLGNITSSLPWNIGQDGTGAYPYNLDGDIDEMAIWRRTLTLDEIHQLYNDGSGLDLQGLGNQAPAASFTSTTTDLTANFTDTSTDSDGSISSRSWNFGDGNSSSAVSPSHTYAATGRG